MNVSKFKLKIENSSKHREFHMGQLDNDALFDRFEERTASNIRRERKRVLLVISN